MTNQEKFIENVNRVLQEVDYKKLDQSCNGENPEYAKLTCILPVSIGGLSF